MKLRVLLADDEPLAIQRLVTLLGAMPDVEIVGSARDGDEAAAEIARLKPDLVFLDIRMPKQSGLPLARSLREVPETEVVFVTAFDHFALEAFDADAVDYLLKPVETDRLEIALEKARRRRTGTMPNAPEDPSTPSPKHDAFLDGFWVDRRRGRVWVPLSSIRWIEAARDYVLLHTETGSYLMRSTMEGLEAQVTSRGFIRVSRSAYVRLAGVQGFYKQGSYSNVVILSDGSVVRVGVSFVTAVSSAVQASRDGEADPLGQGAGRGDNEPA